MYPAGEDGVVRGEYGFLSPDGVYRTTVYTSSANTGFMVVAQTREQRDQQENKEYEYLYSTKNSQVCNSLYRIDYRGWCMQGDSRDTYQAGQYWWDGEDGYRRVVTYTADNTGYHPHITQVKLRNRDD